MALIYPTTGDEDLTEEQLADPEVAFADFASEWSDFWVVEMYAEDPEAGDDEDDENPPVVVGPMEPREAWDLATELDTKRPDWTFAVVPLFSPQDADTLIARLEADD